MATSRPTANVQQTQKQASPSDAGNIATPSESEPPSTPEETVEAVEQNNAQSFRPGTCTNCGNPHLAIYGEGRWSCHCGARGAL